METINLETESRSCLAGVTGIGEDLPSLSISRCAHGLRSEDRSSELKPQRVEAGSRKNLEGLDTHMKQIRSDQCMKTAIGSSVLSASANTADTSPG